MATVGGILLGTVLALMRISGQPWLMWPAAAYVNTMRSVPLVMVILWFFLLVPFVVGRPIGAEWSATLTFIAFEAAFFCEIVRSGILALHKGQSEAAAALGLSRGQAMRLVLLPQALRVIVPPMTSQYLNITKNSSLAIAIGYPDLVASINVTINQTGQAIENILIIMAAYLSVSLSISAFMNWYNKRIALRER